MNLFGLINSVSNAGQAQKLSEKALQVGYNPGALSGNNLKILGDATNYGDTWGAMNKHKRSQLLSLAGQQGFAVGAGALGFSAKEEVTLLSQAKDFLESLLFKETFSGADTLGGTIGCFLSAALNPLDAVTDVTSAIGCAARGDIFGALGNSLAALPVIGAFAEVGKLNKFLKGAKTAEQNLGLIDDALEGSFKALKTSDDAFKNLDFKDLFKEGNEELLTKFKDSVKDQKFDLKNFQVDVSGKKKISEIAGTESDLSLVEVLQKDPEIMKIGDPAKRQAMINKLVEKQDECPEWKNFADKEVDWKWTESKDLDGISSQELFELRDKSVADYKTNVAGARDHVEMLKSKAPEKIGEVAENVSEKAGNVARPVVVGFKKSFTKPVSTELIPVATG
jgi:hypothetical protein